MENIIKEIGELEERKKGLIYNNGDENEIIECDNLINSLVLSVSNHLSINMHLIGPYLAILESVDDDNCYDYVEEDNDTFIKYAIKSMDDDEIVFGEKPLDKVNDSLIVYNVSISPSMLSLRMQILNDYPVLKEFIDGLITYQINNDLTIDSLDRFFDMFVQESLELRKVKKKKKKDNN